MSDADVLQSLLEGELPSGRTVTPEVDRLAGLADLLGESADRAPLAMRAEARTDLRNQLIREANARADAPPSLLTRMRERMTGTAERIAWSTRTAVAGGTAAMVLSTGGVAAAASQSLPGDLFYDLKLAAEDVVLALGADGLPHADGLLGQATTRVEEAATAVERDRMDAAAGALDLADEHARDGARVYLQEYLDSGDTAVLGELGRWVVQTHRRLDLLPPLDGSAASALADLRTSLNRIGQRIEVLTTGACTSCDLGVHDDPDADADQARGTEADGTPPTPASPVDLTFIPAADQPFQACPCVPAAPPGQAVAPPVAPAPAPGSSAPPPAEPAPTGGGGGGSPDPDPAPEPGGSGSGLPLPDPGEILEPVTAPLPDPVREVIEDVIDGLPLDGDGLLGDALLGD